MRRIIMADSLFIMPFGKHKGDPIEDIPTSYLEWLTEQDFFIEWFAHGSAQIGKELAFRTRLGDGDEPEDDQG
jgi:uncharacterized protein (DUF3820 family)